MNPTETPEYQTIYRLFLNSAEETKAALQDVEYWKAKYHDEEKASSQRESEHVNRVESNLYRLMHWRSLSFLITAAFLCARLSYKNIKMSSIVFFDFLLALILFGMFFGMIWLLISSFLNAVDMPYIKDYKKFFIALVLVSLVIVFLLPLGL